MTQAVEISTDRSRLDVDLVHGFLSTSYWAAGRSREVVQRSLENSLCFGAYAEGRQVGFARVITDSATFAYLADVFVVPEARGRGISKLLVARILAAPELQGLNVWLKTRDAHRLYERFGFKVVESPENVLVRAGHT